MNKKAEEKWLSFWNVLAWAVIAIILLIGVNFYNNTETDVRLEEAKVLNQKITDCLVQPDGTLSYNIDQNFNLYESCALKREIFETKPFFYAEITLTTTDNQQITSLSYGSNQLGFDCQIKTEDKNLAVCYNEEIFVYDQNNNPQILKIKTASNNQGKESQ